MNPAFPEPPFIWCFKTPQAQYVYDVNSGSILKTSTVMWDTLQALGKRGSLDELTELYGEHDLHECLAEIKAHQKEGRFLPRKPAALAFAESDEELEHRLRHQQRLLILNVTEFCNLRCSYCVYGEAHSDYRPHSHRHMPWEIARQAVDLFLASSMEVPEVGISFYGGEPLANFDLIDRVACYAKAIRPEGLSFQFTTNCTLLTDNIVESLIEHDIMLVVSFDGPPEIHDQQRRDAQGHGTFQTVINKLHHLKQRCPDFYKTRTGVNVTYQDAVDLQKVRAFFASHKELFNGLHLTSNPVYRRPTGEVPPNAEAIEQAWAGMAQEYMGNILSGRASDPFLNSIYESGLKRIHRRQQTPMKLVLQPLGCCLPGLQRLFCNIDGTLTVCERVGKDLAIGTVQDGFDLGKIRSLMEEFTASLSASGCLSCPAVRLCTSCFINAERISGKAVAKMQDCEAIRTTLEHMFSVYCAIGEQDETLLRYFDEQV